VEGWFAQASVLGSSGVLLFGLMILWRRGITAYISAFKWQSIVLAALTAAVGYFGHDADLYWVAALVFAVKGVAIPRLFTGLAHRVAPRHETDPVINTPSSLVLAGLLILLAYGAARPLQTLSTLPTRDGMPLALGLLFVSLFVIVSRKNALTQVIGFLMLENAISLLAVLATYGVPLVVELGIFLDVLMGFLVMQIFLYDIHDTFNSLDVDVLNRLRH
jgi:hydrogenase-4 component E